MKNMLLILQVLKNKKNFFSPYRCRFLDGDDYIFLQIRNKHSTHTHTHTAASYINERNKISLPRVWQGKYYQYGNILQQAQRRVCLMFKTERVESQCHLQKWNAKNFHQAKSITASVTRRQKENVEKKKRVLTPGNIYSAEVKATTRERNEKEKIKLCFASLVCVCLLQVTAHGASTQKNTFALHVVVLNFIFPYAWVVRRWLSKKTIKKKRLKKHVAYIYLWPGSVTHWCWHTVELWLCVFEPVSVCVCDTDEFFIRLPIVVMALTSTVTIARCSRAMARRTCERFCCVRASESVWSEKWTVVVVVAIFATVEHTSAFGFALSWIYRRARVLMQSHLVRCQESLIAHFTINRQTDLRQSKRGRQEAFENVIRFLSYYFFLLACFTCIYFFLFFFFCCCFALVKIEIGKSFWASAAVPVAATTTSMMTRIIERTRTADVGKKQWIFHPVERGFVRVRRQCGDGYCRYTCDQMSAKRRGMRGVGRRLAEAASKHHNNNRSIADVRLANGRMLECGIEKRIPRSTASKS